MKELHHARYAKGMFAHSKQSKTISVSDLLKPQERFELSAENSLNSIPKRPNSQSRSLSRHSQQQGRTPIVLQSVIKESSKSRARSPILLTTSQHVSSLQHRKTPSICKSPPITSDAHDTSSDMLKKLGLSPFMTSFGDMRDQEVHSPKDNDNDDLFHFEFGKLPPTHSFHDKKRSKHSEPAESMISKPSQSRPRSTSMGKQGDSVAIKPYSDDDVQVYHHHDPTSFHTPSSSHSPPLVIHSSHKRRQGDSVAIKPYSDDDVQVYHHHDPTSFHTPSSSHSPPLVIHSSHKRRVSHRHLTTGHMHAAHHISEEEAQEKKRGSVRILSDRKESSTPKFQYDDVDREKKDKEFYHQSSEHDKKSTREGGTIWKGIVPPSLALSNAVSDITQLIDRRIKEDRECIVKHIPVHADVINDVFVIAKQDEAPYLATAGDDGAVMLVDLSEFQKKE
ncbi:hypothetical protein ADUPG1_013191 [Aduncisulcus paluster]|uniref:Uncharacterized protein n=1 Tax=Aduncisulcus paluster TaxID=2918883 RepID=A0ABQ5K231_9EUKA|nr:hypothetical protein ADUPG1_013191 [Aduncisulcus paluster]